MDMQKIWPKVRRLEDAANDGGMGRTERKTVRFPVCEERSPDLTLVGFNLWHKSAQTFGKNDFLNMGCDIFVNGSNADDMSVDLSAGIIFIETEAVFGVRLGETVLVSALAGAHEVNINGNAMTINVPETGIYFGYIENSGISSLAGLEYRLRWENIHPIDPKFLPEGVGGASLPSPQINLMDYGVSLANLMSSTFTIQQGTALWDKMLEVKATGLVPEVQVLSEGKGTTAYVAGWQYDAGVPTACACIGKTISGSNVVEIYMVLLYDATSGTVTVVHNMA